jgi:hypothetical protein
MILASYLTLPKVPSKVVNNKKNRACNHTPTTISTPSYTTMDKLKKLIAHTTSFLLVEDFGSPVRTAIQMADYKEVAMSEFQRELPASRRGLLPLQKRHRLFVVFSRNDSLFL